MATELRVGEATLRPRIEKDRLLSLGEIRVGETPLRNPATRMLPWFDTLEGHPFTRFELEAIDEKPEATVLHTVARSDPDYPFMERRDSSGDVCLRPESWDAAPRTAALRIVLQPAAETIDGQAFSGLRYWFEYESDEAPLHRLLDRQTWELGGGLAGNHVVCRNLFDEPRKRLAPESAFSTVGLDSWAKLLPGNLWGRWSLLPAFDMQYGEAGTLLAWFDRISNIRSVVETMPGEDWLRVIDVHLFAQSATVRTNPKTVVFRPGAPDHTAALNLWTRLQDREQSRACEFFGIEEEEPPAVMMSQNHWRDFEFESSYDHCLETAAEFGADYIFIDPVWEHGEALRRTVAELLPEAEQKGTILEKWFRQNMCCTLDFEVAEAMGGEAGLKRLCDRAREKGVRVISWMSMHYTPLSALRKRQDLGHGLAGIFAAKESGRHPDTGYPGECWTANLNTPIFERIREQIHRVCDRTGLAGFLWDSFSNLGWWQVDYSDGSLRTQFEKMGQLYAELANRGLYIQPEAVVTFSNHSCCGLHGGNVYAGELAGYGYNSVISLQYDGERQDCRILRGEKPVDELFECFAHRRVPPMALHDVPAAERDPAAERAIKNLIQAYRAVRDRMHRRTVLPDGAGVLWEGREGGEVLFALADHAAAESWEDVISGQTTAELRKNHCYRR